MPQKTYKLNSIRLLEFWIAPILIIAFISFLVYADYEKYSRVAIGKLFFYLFLTLLFIGPFVWLFFNHLKNISIKQLKFDDHNISFYSENMINIIDYNEIIDVIEYSNDRYGNGKMPWSDIVKWKIKTDNQEFIISSLIISKNNLRRFIKKDRIFEATYFPTL